MQVAKGRNRTSPRYWESLLFFLLLSGPPKFRARDPSASLSAEIDSVVAFAILVWLLGAIWVVIQIAKSGTIPRLNSLQAMALVLLVALALSVFYSPGKALTVFTVFQYGTTVMFAHYFVRRFGTTSFLHHLFAGYLLSALSVIVSAVVAPETVLPGGGTRLRGDLIGLTGGIGVLGMTMLIARVPRISRTLFFALFAVLLAMTIASATRTAYLALGMVIALSVLSATGTPNRRLVPFILIALFAATVFELGPDAVEFLARDTRSISTLNSRTLVWTEFINQVWDRSPIFGLGYYAASRTLVVNPLASGFLAGPGTAHSAFVEVFVGAGLLGFVSFVTLLVGMAFISLRLLVFHRRDPESFALVALLCVVLIFMVVATEAIQPGALGFTFWSLTALMPQVLSRNRSLSPTRNRSLSPRSQMAER